MDERDAVALRRGGFAIENYHRGLKQFCGVERCQAARAAQRNHIGLALRAFLRLEWHFFTTGVSGFEAKLRLIREAVQVLPGTALDHLAEMGNCVTPILFSHFVPRMQSPRIAVPEPGAAHGTRS